MPVELKKLKKKIKIFSQTAPPITIIQHHPVQSAILKQRNVDALAVGTKHIPTVTQTHVDKGHYVEGSKKSRNAEHHDMAEEKKLIKGVHHKSSEDSSSAKKGSDTKESHNKQYDEEAGHDKKSEDEADESSFNEDGDHKNYDSEYKEANKKKVRKFEQG